VNPLRLTDDWFLPPGHKLKSVHASFERRFDDITYLENADDQKADDVDAGSHGTYVACSAMGLRVMCKWPDEKQTSMEGVARKAFLIPMCSGYMDKDTKKRNIAIPANRENEFLPAVNVSWIHSNSTSPIWTGSQNA